MGERLALLGCMERPKRAATKVTDFRRYHLSGDLDTTLQGRVDSRVSQFEMAKTQEELQQQLEEQKAQSKRLFEEAELMRIQHELEAERLKQKKWQVAMDQLQAAKVHAEEEHTRYLEEIKEAANSVKDNTAKSALEWFKQQADKLGRPSGAPEPLDEEAEKARAEKEAREKEIRDLQDQQEQIAHKLAQLTGRTKEHEPRPTHDMLLEQLKATLTSKKEEDPNKMLLKALTTNQNKATGEGGTNILKPSLYNSITATDNGSMAEWLASLNKQEEGESEVSKLILAGEGDPTGKLGKMRSGMLDKATTNIQQKQVWPQQNLGEDWADEEVEFK